MANRAKKDDVRMAVAGYLAEAKASAPEVYPININALSKALKFHRDTLGKYVTDEELEKARQEQEQFARTKFGREKTEAEERIAKSKAEIDALRTRCEALLGQIVKAEGNAQRLGIDPSELWKPLTAPPHTLPH